MNGEPGEAGPGHWILRLDQAGALVAGIGVLLMMTVGAVDVIATHFFNRPVPGAFELTETMMVASIFLAVAMAQRERRHIRVAVLVDRLPQRGRASFEVFAHLLSAAVFVLIAWFGWESALKSLSIGEFSSGLIRFPVWPAKLALAIGATMMIAQLAVDAVRSARVALR